MSRILLSIIFLLAVTVSAYAQNNACAGPDPTDNVANPTKLNLILTDQTTVNPNNQPVVNDYTLQVLLAGKPISMQNVPKSSFIALTGTPANCYSFNLPTFPGVTNNTLYKIAMIANGPVGSSPMGVSTQSFFLQGAPTAPATLRLAIYNMLSKMYQLVLSTETSKPWFRPIGR